MIYQKISEKGKISFTKKAIGKIIMQCINETPMDIIVSNPKGKAATFSAMVGGNSDSGDHIQIDLKADEIFIELFVIIPFGVSIKLVKQYLNDSIREKMNLMLQTEPQDLGVNVVGMLMKSGKVVHWGEA